MKKISLFAVVTVGALMLATSVQAGPGGTNRPFKGTGLGETSVDVSSGGPVFTSATNGTIIATHLGKGTYTIAATQDWSTYPCAVVAGSFVFVAANGATMSASVDGTTCELAPFDNTSYGSALDLTIIGGTGRFAGATGTLEITGSSTGPEGGPFNDVMSATGKISY
jgi:hypothetical protein